MERPSRPEPTRLSPYFFEQILSHHPPNRDATQVAQEETPPSGAAVEQPEGLLAAHPLGTTAGVVDFSDPNAAVQADADQPATATNTSTDPSSAPTLSPPQPRPDAGAPARVTSNAEADAAMWHGFTPAPFRHRFEHLVRSESAQTEALRRAVDAAWRDVERIQARNTARRAALDELLANPSAPWREEVRGKLYWTAKDIVQRYGFEVDMRHRGAAAAEAADRGGPVLEENRVTLDFSVVRDGARVEGQHPSGGGGGAGEAVAEVECEDGEEPADAATGTGRAAASHMSPASPSREEAADLLNPCLRPHFLRRLFAPLQQARPSLPKWTSLLLTDVHGVQKAVLPDLEARVQACVLFKVPLHRPFLEARAALQTCALQTRTAPDVERRQVAAYRQLEQHGRLWVDFVEAHAGPAAAVAAAVEAEAVMTRGGPMPHVPDAEAEVADLAQRWLTAEALWTLLLDELDTCKRFCADALPGRVRLGEAVTSEMTTIAEAVRTHRDKCASTVSGMTADAEACAELLHRNGQRIVTAVDEMESTFTSERDRLRDCIAARESLLGKLAGQQEKSARRVREALKGFFMEQLQYEEASQALLQDQLSLAQLEASHTQLRTAVQVRHEGAVEGKKHAAALLTLLKDGDAAVQQLFDACEVHYRRLETDNYYIQCRLVDQCTAALQQRCRCVQAMATLYEQRYDDIEARAGDSWQLQFLVSGERDWAVANLSDVRAELTQLERDWGTLCAMRLELELEAVPLDPHRGTPEWQALMTTLRHLDAPSSLQRRLPTLRGRAATADASGRLAVGCGPQAARQLQRDSTATASAAASVAASP